MVTLIVNIWLTPISSGPNSIETSCACATIDQPIRSVITSSLILDFLIEICYIQCPQKIIRANLAVIFCWETLFTSLRTYVRAICKNRYITLNVLSMLEYFKTILKKVSFDRKLFEKELRKAIKSVLRDELSELKRWCYDNFGHLYENVLEEQFALAYESR